MDKNQLTGILMGVSCILIALILKRIIKPDIYVESFKINRYFYSLVALGVFILGLIIYDFIRKL